MDAGWLSKRLGPLGDPEQIRLLLFLTAPHTPEEMVAEFSWPAKEAEARLGRLVDADLVGRMDGAGTEYVIDLRVLFSLLEELEKLTAVRPEEHDDPLNQTIGVAVRGAQAPDEPGAALVVVRGLGWGTRKPLVRDPDRRWIAGRDTRCDLPLDYDAYVSKQHAEVRFEGDHYVLRDLDSTNGTSHNLKLMGPGAQAPLAHGDLVGIGKTLLLFWDRPMTR